MVISAKDRKSSLELIKKHPDWLFCTEYEGGFRQELTEKTDHLRDIGEIYTGITCSLGNVNRFYKTGKKATGSL